jgi:hypothetical protein
MMKGMWFRGVAGCFPLVLLVVSLFGCERHLPDCLIVLPGARGIQQHYSRGMDQVSYSIQEEYPATKSLDTVKQALAARGWKPMSYEFLHPDRPTSNAVGWTFFEDKRIGSTSVAYEWLGEWKDKRNNIVRYSFRYVDPATKYEHKTYIVRPSNSRLFVVAEYIPEKLAQATIESERRRLKRLKQ